MGRNIQIEMITEHPSSNPVEIILTIERTEAGNLSKDNQVVGLNAYFLFEYV